MTRLDVSGAPKVTKGRLGGALALPPPPFLPPLPPEPVLAVGTVPEGGGVMEDPPAFGVEPTQAMEGTGGGSDSDEEESSGESEEELRTRTAGGGNGWGCWP